MLEISHDLMADKTVSLLGVQTPTPLRILVYIYIYTYINPN